MTGVQHSVDAGHYARQPIHSRDPLIAWSHRRRFRTALALAGPFAGSRVLDYGCGDGTFLGLLHPIGGPPAFAVGAEIDPRVVADCARRFAAVRGLRFVSVADLGGADHAGAYDAVFCMEVLEHVADPLPRLVKQVVRRVAGRRRIGDFPGTSSYTPRELVKSVFAASRPHVARPVFPRSDGSLFHDHKGFNWRVLRATVGSRFDLVDTGTSPFNWPGTHFGTQVWFVARTRAAGAIR